MANNDNIIYAKFNHNTQSTKQAIEDMSVTPRPEPEPEPEKGDGE